MKHVIFNVTHYDPMGVVVPRTVPARMIASTLGSTQPSAPMTADNFERRDDGWVFDLTLHADGDKGDGVKVHAYLRDTGAITIGVPLIQHQAHGDLLDGDLASRVVEMAIPYILMKFSSEKVKTFTLTITNVAENPSQSRTRNVAVGIANNVREGANSLRYQTEGKAYVHSYWAKATGTFSLTGINPPHLLGASEWMADVMMLTMPGAPGVVVEKALAC